jgi:hypothetical protein
MSSAMSIALMTMSRRIATIVFTKTDRNSPRRRAYESARIAAANWRCDFQELSREHHVVT